MKKILFTLALSVLLVVGCEEKDDDKINQAQECLDNATTSADATSCKTIISGIYNEKANRIRCGLVILENGVTSSDIIDAFQAMDTDTSEDPVMVVATKLGLGDLGGTAGIVDSYEEAIADDIKDTCYQSNSVGLKTVAQIIWFGTKAQAALGTSNYTDANDVAAAIGSMSDDDAGEFANDVFDLYCSPTYSNDDICTTLAGQGAGSSDNTTVGAALKACLVNNTCS